MARNPRRMTGSNIKAAPREITPDIVARLLALIPAPASPVAPMKLAKVRIPAPTVSTFSDAGKPRKPIDAVEARAKATTACEGLLGAPDQISQIDLQPPVTRPSNGFAQAERGVRTGSPSRPEPRSGSVGGSPARETRTKPSVVGQREAVKAAPARVAPAPVAANSGVDWIGRRHEIFRAVEAYLKARCILVMVVDRNAQIRTYHVSGKRHQHTLEMLVEHAETLGFEVPC